MGRSAGAPAEVARDAGPSGGVARPISSVLRALDVLADPWSYLVLREAFFGVRRFEDFHRNLGAARNILADRLEHLVAAGVLERRAYMDRPPRSEYRLAPPGLDLFPSIVALMEWGDRWAGEPDGPPLRLKHACGADLRLAVVCDGCGEPLHPHDVKVLDGPGAGPEPEGDPSPVRRRSGADPYLRGRPCSVARALSMLGNRWGIRILRESFFGVKRFDALQANLGVARNVLAEQLQTLVDGGLLEKVLYSERPSRYEYVLGPAGIALYPAMLTLMVWGDRWRRPSAGVPHLLRHLSCGRISTPLAVCEACGAAVTAGTTRYETAYDSSPYVPTDRPVRL